MLSKQLISSGRLKQIVPSLLTFTLVTMTLASQINTQAEAKAEEKSKSVPTAATKSSSSDKAKQTAPVKAAATNKPVLKPSSKPVSVQKAKAIMPAAKPASNAISSQKPNEEKPVAESNSNSVSNLSAANSKRDFDPALISVLKDLLKAMKEPGADQNFQDESQKAAYESTVEALSQYLNDNGLKANRIIQEKDKSKLESQMTTEAWESGDIYIKPNTHVSLTAVWAKRANGLIQVTAAGSKGDQGQFVLVLSAKSVVDSGMDIQTQEEVNYWLGKMSGFVIDSTLAAKEVQKTVSSSFQTEPVAIATNSKSNSKKKDFLPAVLKAPLTDRSRKLLAQRNNSLALRQSQESSAVVDSSSKDSVPSVSDDQKLVAKAPVQEVLQNNSTEDKSKDVVETTESLSNADSKVQEVNSLPRLSTATSTESDASADESRGIAVASPAPSPATVSDESKQPSKVRLGDYVPKGSLKLLIPDKVIAGEYLTVCLLNAKMQPEANVELGFNGIPVITDENGQASYSVPEDSSPGHSLHVSISRRSDIIPRPVEVLQPLSRNTGLPPSVERVVSSANGRTNINVYGHNFDGLCSGNKVVIDGNREAKVLAASPVEVIALLPNSLPSGLHSLCLSRGGQKSQMATMEVVAVEVVSFNEKAKHKKAKHKGKKSGEQITVRVLGTDRAMLVHVKNNSPETIKIVKGNDIAVRSSGGQNNQVLLMVERLKQGPVDVKAVLE